MEIRKFSYEEVKNVILRKIIFGDKPYKESNYSDFEKLTWSYLSGGEIDGIIKFKGIRLLELEEDALFFWILNDLYREGYIDFSPSRYNLYGDGITVYPIISLSRKSTLERQKMEKKKEKRKILSFTARLWFSKSLGIIKMTLSFLWSELFVPFFVSVFKNLIK